MIFEHFGGEAVCNTAEEAKKAFACTVNGVNAFWIHEEEYPCLSVLVKGGLAYAILFPEKGHAGIQAYAPEPPEGDYTTFIINAPSEEIEIRNDYVLPRELAEQIVLEFFSAQNLLGSLEWEEL